MRQLAPLLCGLLFALGLGLAGMTRPDKVLGFLQLRDPDLAFVMGGAVLVTFFGFPAVLRRRRPLLDSEFHVPARRRVDLRLVLGAAAFGVGWGLTGLCPGPALTDLVTLNPDLLLFCAAMLVGLTLTRRAA
ncbi:MAG: YeeE/YedE family protein [Myxococcales bacterium]|nr:YeeE/YedE family protein [Myxococcales bacterium]